MPDGRQAELKLALVPALVKKIGSAAVVTPWTKWVQILQLFGQQGNVSSYFVNYLFLSRNVRFRLVANVTFRGAHACATFSAAVPTHVGENCRDKLLSVRQPSLWVKILQENFKIWIGLKYYAKFNVRTVSYIPYTNFTVYTVYQFQKQWL